MRGFAAIAAGSQTWSIGQEREPRVVIHEVVEPPRPQAVAGDDPVAVERLAAAGHDAGLHQIDHAVGDDVAVDAEVAAVLEVAQGLVRHAPEPDLQRRAIVDDGGDVAGDHLGGLTGWRMAVLRHRRVDAHQGVEAVEMDEALAVGARHRRVDLGDDVPRDAEYRGGQIHGDAQADEAARVRRGDLEQGDIDRQPARRQQLRHLLQANRHVLELIAGRRGRARRCRRKTPDGGSGSSGRRPSPAGRTS